MAGNGEPAPSTDEATGPAVGQTLKAMRRAKRLTGQQLGALAGMSQAKVSRIETGAVTPEIADIEALGRALGASPGDLERLVEQAVRAHRHMTEWRPGVPGVAERQREFGELEADARHLRVFQPAVVIGLVQTSEYARSVLASFQHHFFGNPEAETSAAVSEAVSARVRRHEILVDTGKRFHFVMSEAVFSNRLSGAAVMLAQLERVREVARQDNVDLRILPTGAALSVPPYHGFTLMDDRCVTIDLFNTPIMSRVRSDIRLYRHVFDELEKVATEEIEPILDRYVDLYVSLTARHRGAGGD